ncbi:MAG: D-alanine--D-alanine ligase [Clostridia bacterium]|nr:D-alanine--D-alanine ligase [Clostridia bacterium]
MRIVVLAGGLSPERDVSLSTGTQVCNALRQCGQQAILVDLFYGEEALPTPIENAFLASEPLSPRPVKAAAPDLAAVRASRPDSGLGGVGKNVIELCKAADIVFMAMHGIPGENGMLQAMFDMMEIKYTGTGYFGSALAMDKAVTKELFRAHGILTPKGRLFKKGEKISFPLPCIVKPCSGGSSIGVTKAFTPQALQAAAEAAFRCEDNILVETFYPGREFTCGILGAQALPPAEVIPKGDFYDYEHKYQNGLITEVCPAQIPEALTHELMETSLKAFETLSLSVYARMDYIYSTDGRLFCLEANTLPGMTPTSHFPQMARAAGMDYAALCMKIIELSLAK